MSDTELSIKENIVLYFIVGIICYFTLPYAWALINRLPVEVITLLGQGVVVYSVYRGMKFASKYVMIKNGIIVRRDISE